jgi:predicted metal-dependent phosphoesterase TrpH
LLKADFHMHTGYSPDSAMAPEKLVARCLKVGLNCIAVTDHNTIEGALEVRKIAPFLVIIGEEVASSEGEITGLFLTEDVPRGLTALETARRIKEQGALVSIPHPFDRFRGSVIIKQALEGILPHIDIVEAFNARNNLDSDNRKAYEFAHQNGLLISGVSDAHTPFELGRTYVEMPEFDGTAEGFKRALAEGRIVGRRVTPLIHVLTTLTKVKKRLLGTAHRR